MGRIWNPLLLRSVPAFFSSKAAPVAGDVLEALVFAREELRCVSDSAEAALLEHDPSKRVGRAEYKLRYARMASKSLEAALRMHSAWTQQTLHAAAVDNTSGASLEVEGGVSQRAGAASEAEKAALAAGASREMLDQIGREVAAARVDLKETITWLDSSGSSAFEGETYSDDPAEKSLGAGRS